MRSMTQWILDIPPRWLVLGGIGTALGLAVPSFMRGDLMEALFKAFFVGGILMLMLRWRAEKEEPRKPRGAKSESEI